MREISDDELRKILEEHNRWLNTDGEEGSCANLSYCNLSSTDLLHDAKLCEVDLHGADLRGTDLRGTDFFRADLQDAKLNEADLRGAKLYGADLHGTDLRGTDREGVEGLASYLQPEQLEYYRVKLPEWLDRCLFDTLGAFYWRAPEAASKSLEFSTDKLKGYLGTYFPRSYAESFSIFSNIFSKQFIKDRFIKKGEISIMDLGSGTGGNLIGLLETIDNNIDEQIDIKIVSIDGNEDALCFQEEILNTFRKRTDKKIIFKKEQRVIEKHSDIVNIANKLDEEKFDIIITFKCLSELAIYNLPEFRKIYSIFPEIASGIMSEFSFLIILDVTTLLKEIGNIKYFVPTVLNKQINSFESKNNFLKTIIPKPCFAYASKCDLTNNLCFTQQQFKVNHSRKANDISKVTYRVLVTEKVYKSLNLRVDNNVTYITKWKFDGRDKQSDYRCFYSKETDKEEDSFKL